MIPLLLASLALAETPRIEVHGNAGVSAHIGLRTSSVAIGVGGGARVEQGVFGGDLNLGYGFGMGPVLDSSLGGDLSAPWKVYRPAIGLELGGLWGHPLRFVDSDDNLVPYRLPVLLSVRVRAHPAVLRVDRITVRLLGLSYGPGFGRAVTSFRLEMLRFGVQL